MNDIKIKETELNGKLKTLVDSGLISPNEVEKIFLYPEKRILGILFTPKCKLKSMILDMNLEFPQDEFSYCKAAFYQMFENKVISMKIGSDILLRFFLIV